MWPAHGNPRKLALKANAQQAQSGAQCRWVRVISLKNCAHYNWGLATLPGEIDVRFFSLISLFAF